MWILLTWQKEMSFVQINTDDVTWRNSNRKNRILFVQLNARNARPDKYSDSHKNKSFVRWTLVTPDLTNIQTVTKTKVLLLLLSCLACSSMNSLPFKSGIQQQAFIPDTNLCHEKVDFSHATSVLKVFWSVSNKAGKAQELCSTQLIRTLNNSQETDFTC